MKLNRKATDSRVDYDATRLAGGYGPFPAAQDPEALLRRSVLACLLWEDLAYTSGQETAEQILRLVAQVPPERVAAIAVEARMQQKLRHVPLFLACEMARLPTHRQLVGQVLAEVVRRPDELCEFLALYWAPGKQPLAAQVKKGLARAFTRFDAYQLAKWNRGTQVKLRDVLFLTHAKPRDETQAAVWAQLVANTLPVPDTWEVALSRGTDTREAWTRLIRERRLGGLATLRNLRNMQQAGVPEDLIAEAIAALQTQMLLPLNFLAAARAAPAFSRALEQAMLASVHHFPQLPGTSVFIVDVSGSMGTQISAKSQLSRVDVAAAMAMMAVEVCERIHVYATAGSDPARQHQTQRLPVRQGFGMMDQIQAATGRLGGGGIFTRQCRLL